MVILITAAQVAVTCVPPLQAILGTQAVPFADGLLILAATSFAIIEIEKRIRLALAGVGQPR